jgi:hypothetical protein
VIAHDADCAAMRCIGHWYDLAQTFYSMGPCSCTAAAELRELLGAIDAHSCPEADPRLQAALAPFREQEEK